MSTDTIALFDITLEQATAEHLLHVITMQADFATALIDRYRSRWRVQTWSLDPSPGNGDPTLWGPGGFAIRFRERTVELYHMMSFGTFTSDLWRRDALRQTCADIARFTGSDRVIYTHELMPHEGADLHAIAIWLQTNIGPPAASFSELHAADYYGPHAWYLESVR